MQHHIRLFINPLQFYYEFMANRKAKKTALKLLTTNLNTSSKPNTKSVSKTRYELTKTINKIS